jgi:uncharacterized protein YndB with AHSA1/START domain
LSKEVEVSVTREVLVDASPEEVWEALSSDEGREDWLEEPAREIHVEQGQEPYRLVWWWSHPNEPATRVEFVLVAAPRGTRVIVTESLPAFPLASFASSFAMVFA